jgi:hypothetical protein
MLNGQVVGKWQKKGTKLTFTLFENATEKDKKTICQSAECLWTDIKRVDWHRRLI